MADRKQKIRNKFFLSTKDKDDVDRERCKEDFDLCEDADINFPKYSSDVVLKSFVERDEKAKQTFFAKTWARMKHNIIGQTMWIVIIYLCFYGVFQILFVQQAVNTSNLFERSITYSGNLSDPQCKTIYCKCFRAIEKTNVLQENSIPSISNPDIDRCIEANNVAEFVGSWAKKQSSITKLLTFFLGFYVSQVMGRWWKQVTANPSIDSVCLSLSGIVFSTTESKERIVDDETQFKKKIARYCLLSWTMCFSNFSQCLKNSFNDEKKYIEKGLLTQEEYNTLSGNKSSDGGSLDGWIDKWALPLTWASQLINQDFQKKGNKVVPKDTKEIMVALNAYQNSLLKIVNTFENKLPKIQTQAVQFAVWAFILLGVIAGQQTSNRFMIRDLGWGCLLINIPFVELVKYALINAWMKVAIYLQNPFGEDIGYDIDLVSYLDVEIWKAAAMITQSDAPIS